MRHRRKGRVLGRSPSHQRALLRNLASALFLTERDAEDDENQPKVKGRIVTTIQKAKEVKPLVERCITIALRSMPHAERAQAYSPPTDDTGELDRKSESFGAWRKSDDYAKWRHANAPVVNARRRVYTLLGDREATRICFTEVAPRFVSRKGGYTRVLRLAKPRLGDAGTRAILEFVGVRDRTQQKAQAPVVEAEADASVSSS
jgi:large subunit ribosomal protein L17